MVVLPPPVQTMNVGLAAQCSLLVEDAGNIIPTIQSLVHSMAYMISHMEPAAAREQVILTVQRDLPILVMKIIDEVRKSKGGIITPRTEDKLKFGG